jgi:hypothetical protein
VLRRDEGERARGGRAVVVREPESEIDERRREGLEDALDRGRLDSFRPLDVDVDDDATALRVAEADLDDRALLRPVGNLVRERARESAGADERVDGGEARQAASVARSLVGAFRGENDCRACVTKSLLRRHGLAGSVDAVGGGTASPPVGWGVARRRPR